MPFATTRQATDRDPAGTGQTNAKVVATLVRWAEGQLPGLVDQAYESVVDRIALYRAGQPVPQEDPRRSIGQNLSFVLAAISQPRAPRDHSAPRETGHRRAQQAVPLPEVLQAYRISFATLWEALVEHARTGQPAAADALLDARA